MPRRAARHVHKLMAVAAQPGGLATMTDDELMVWIADRRAGLERAEGSKRGHKARAPWREAVEDAEAELRRRSGLAEELTRRRAVALARDVKGRDGRLPATVATCPIGGW